MKKSFELGNISKLDLDILNVTKENIIIELDILKKDIERINDKFLYYFRIDISNYVLEDITPANKNISKNISKIGLRDLKILGYQKKLIEENIKYGNYNDKMPEISIGLEHVKEEDTALSENRVSLVVSKILFDYNSSLESEKISLETQNIKINQNKDKIKLIKLETIEKYDSYLKDYIISKNKADLERKKHKIIKEKYALGEASFIQVIDIFNDYLDYEIEAEKYKNLLNGYIYIVMVQGEGNEE